MQDILLSAVIALFAVAAGFIVIACSNTEKGNFGKGLIISVITALVLSFRELRAHEFVIAGCLIGGTLVGSVIATFLPQDNGLKQFLRSRLGLRIQVGSSKKKPKK